MASPGSVIGSAFVKISPDSAGFEQALLGGLSGPLSKAEGMFGGLGKVAAGAIIGIGASAVAVGAIAVTMASKFQTATTQLITGAGESTKNIDMIRQGLLAMAPAIGVGPTALANALYFVESAGFHGAAGLNVLRIAAEGAKVGNADMTVVADALTTALNAYHLPATDAAKVMNDLTAAVSLGKTHMEDLAASMGAIVPIAAALGVPLDQVTAAMATMTVQGTDASKASQSLRFLMSAMAGPTSAAAAEFKGLGIGMAQIPGITKSVSDELKLLGLHTSEVSYTLTHQGLLAALTEITDAIGKKFPVGSAAYEAALKGAVGGTRGLTAALELTGQNMATFTGNLSTIDTKVRTAGDAVSGWALIQTTFAERVDRARAALDVFMIRIGTALLPILGQMISAFTDRVLPALEGFAAWFAKTGEPALVKFGGWVGANIITPFVHIAQAVIPPLLTALGFVVGHLDAIKTPALILAGILAAIWATEKISGWVTAAEAAIKKIAALSIFSGVTGGGGGGSGIPLGVQKVWVVNMPAGGVPGAPGGPGGSPAPVPTSLLTYLGPLGLLANTALVDWSQIAGTSDQVKKSIMEFNAKIAPSLLATGASTAQVAAESQAIDDAVMSGKIKTQAQLKAFENNWFLTNVAAKEVNTATGETVPQFMAILSTSKAANTIIGQGFGRVQTDLLVWESALQKAGVSGAISAAAQAALSNFIKLHGPVTANEMAAFQFAATATAQTSAGMARDALTLGNFVKLHGPLTATQLGAFEATVTASHGSGAYVAAVMGTLSAWTTKYGPLTVAQLQALLINLHNGQTSAFDIWLSLKTVNAIGSQLPQTMADIAGALSRLRGSIPGSVGMPLGGPGGHFSGGGIADYPETGRLAMLHGKEMVVPFDKAGWLWPLMQTALATGKPPVFNPVPLPAVPSGLMTTAAKPSVPMGGGQTVTISNTYHVGSQSTRAEMEQVVSESHRRLMLALRAR